MTHKQTTKEIICCKWMGIKAVIKDLLWAIHNLKTLTGPFSFLTPSLPCYNRERRNVCMLPPCHFLLYSSNTSNEVFLISATMGISVVT